MLTLRFEVLAVFPKAVTHTAFCCITNTDLVNKIRECILSQTSMKIPSDCVLQLLTEQRDTLYMRIFDEGVYFLSESEYGLELGKEKIDIYDYTVVNVTV